MQLCLFSGSSKENAQTVEAISSSLNRWKKEPRTLFVNQPLVHGLPANSADEARLISVSLFNRGTQVLTVAEQKSFIVVLSLRSIFKRRNVWVYNVRFAHLYTRRIKSRWSAAVAEKCQARYGIFFLSSNKHKETINMSHQTLNKVKQDY